MFGFGHEPVCAGDLVVIAHGNYLNIGIIHQIDDTNYTTREMFGWYTTDAATETIRGYRKDGGIMVTEKTRTIRRHAYKVFPLPDSYKNTQIGKLFCDAYMKKYKVQL